MSNSISNLNQTEINCINGGKYCHTVITVKNPDYFSETDISHLQKTPGACVFYGMEAGSINLMAGEETFICDCKEDYKEDSFVIQDFNGKVFRKS